MKGVPPERACVVCGNWTHRAGSEPDGAQRCHGHSLREDIVAKRTLSGVQGKKAPQPAKKRAAKRLDRKDKALAELRKVVAGVEIGTQAGRAKIRKAALEGLFAGLAPNAAQAVERILAGQANEIEARSGDEPAGNTEILWDLGETLEDDEVPEPPAEATIQ